ncbi:MAG: hypothetical protein M3P30_11255 [Chloroflexota bacterium]|nr:hypothetical protein [Chloroflexota bacterium]
MGTIDEAVASYVNAVKIMDLGTLMASLTPEAMGKAMAMAGGAPPAGITDIKAEKQSEEGGEYVYNLTVEAASGGGTMMTRWKEIDGAWKVTDLAPVV